MMIATSRASSQRGVELVPRGTTVHNLAAQVRACLPAADGVRLVDGAVRVTVPQAAWMVDRQQPEVEWNLDVLRFIGNRTKSINRRDVHEAHRIMTLGPSDLRTLIDGCRLLPMLDEHQLRNVA